MTKIYLAVRMVKLKFPFYNEIHYESEVAEVFTNKKKAMTYVDFRNLWCTNQELTAISYKLEEKEICTFDFSKEAEKELEKLFKQ